MHTCASNMFCIYEHNYVYIMHLNYLSLLKRENYSLVMWINYDVKHIAILWLCSLKIVAFETHDGD